MFLKDIYSPDLIKTEVYSELYSTIKTTPRCKKHIQNWSQLEESPFLKNKPKTEVKSLALDQKLMCAN